MTNPISDISTMRIFDIGPRPSSNRSASMFLYNENAEKNYSGFNGDFPSVIKNSNFIGAIDDLYIWGFLSTVAAFGILLNILTICILFRAKCNGTRYFLLQLTFCDLGSLSICGLELFYMNHQKWLIPVEICPVYLGLESFTSTATIYFILAINFHALSTYNLALKTLLKKDLKEAEYTELLPEPVIKDENYRLEMEEIACDLNEGYEIPLPSPSQSVRSLTIDYSKKKNGVAVIFPALFTWFIAASVSIPLFVFGMVIPNEMYPKICGVMNFDNFSSHLMQVFMISIRIAIPTLILVITTILLAIRIFGATTTSPSTSNGSSNNNGCDQDSQKRIMKFESCGLDENVRIVLKLAFALSMTFIMFGVQKMYGSLLFELLSKPFMHFKYPKMNQLIGLVMDMINFMLPAVRPILYFQLDGELKGYLIFWKKRKRKSQRKR